MLHSLSKSHEPISCFFLNQCDLLNTCNDTTYFNCFKFFWNYFTFLCNENFFILEKTISKQSYLFQKLWFLRFTSFFNLFFIIFKENHIHKTCNFLSYHVKIFNIFYCKKASWLKFQHFMIFYQIPTRTHKKKEDVFTSSSWQSVSEVKTNTLPYDIP